MVGTFQWNFKSNDFGWNNSVNRDQKWNSKFWGNPRAKIVYINEQIKAPNIIIIDDDKKNLGTFSRKRALEIAEERELDLVQIAYNPDEMISTVRLTDYGKYMYQKDKEEKGKKKQQKGKEMKEVKISYAIGDNDLNLKMRKMEEFLTSWINVKISIRLKWRERIYADKALEKIMFVKNALAAFGRAQYDTPKKEAQWYSIVLFAK